MAPVCPQAGCAAWVEVAETNWMSRALSADVASIENGPAGFMPSAEKSRGLSLTTASR